MKVQLLLNLCILSVLLLICGCTNHYEKGKDFFEDKEFSLCIEELVQVSEGNKHYKDAQILIEEAENLISISVRESFYNDSLAEAKEKANELADIGQGKSEQIGTINSIVDGYDVQRVNVWSSVDPYSRKQIGYLVNGDKVDVLKSSGDYYLIYSKSKNLRGYLMKGFVVNIR